LPKSKGFEKEVELAKENPQKVPKFNYQKK